MFSTWPGYPKAGWNVNNYLTGQIQLQCRYQSSMTQQALRIRRERRRSGGLAMQLARSYQAIMSRRRCGLPGYCQRGAGGGAGGAGHARGAGRSSHSTVMAAGPSGWQNDAGPAKRTALCTYEQSIKNIMTSLMHAMAVYKTRYPWIITSYPKDVKI